MDKIQAVPEFWRATGFRLYFLPVQKVRFDCQTIGADVNVISGVISDLIGHRRTNRPSSVNRCGACAMALGTFSNESGIGAEWRPRAD